MSAASTKTTEQKPATVNNAQPENAILVQNNNVASASESESAFWKNDWIRAQNTLSSIRRSLASFPSPPLRILRVSQLDADLLDTELFAMLKEQLWQAFSLLDPYYKRYELELMAIMQFILYRFSIYETGASFGAQLQNLKYRNEKMHSGGLQSTANDAPLSKMRRVLFGLFTIGGQYVWAKVNRLVTAFSWGDLAENDPRKIFWKSLQKLEHLYYTSALINFLVFLYDGRHLSQLSHSS
ncbi:7136_t:CDS:2 [Paraglomus brasilianum]|uniref:RING-type E3 ubiquitin transferase (cysteine targeting) n=1 Tax=Paraglomus brasilianum TaxID=144538 RepID=A0A9N8ZEL3_9GLOM|nr:7136_t:CDS:2 [Paraglomus brasilianum]